MTAEKSKIEITFGVDGSIRAETIGIKGKACLPHIAELENLLEAVTIDSEYTKDFLEQPFSNLNFGGQEVVDQ